MTSLHAEKEADILDTTLATHVESLERKLVITQEEHELEAKERLKT